MYGQWLGRFQPRVPGLSAGETLRVALPEPARAAGLRGGGSGGEIRPPWLHQVSRLHQDLRRCRSCVDLAEKSCSRLGRGIRQDRVGAQHQSHSSSSPSVSKPKSWPRRQRLRRHHGHASPRAATPPGTPEGTWGRGTSARLEPGRAEPERAGAGPWGPEAGPRLPRGGARTRVGGVRSREV